MRLVLNTIALHHHIPVDIPIRTSTVSEFIPLTTHSRGEISHWTNPPVHHSSWLFRRIYTPTPGIEPRMLKFFGPEPRTLNNWKDVVMYDTIGLYGRLCDFGLH
jgi:hypothetical protein